MDLIGRHDCECKLYDALNIDGNAPKLLLQSMGGIGKTSLAKVVFKRCLKEKYFKHFIWLNADDEQWKLPIATALKIDTTLERWEIMLANSLANSPYPCLAVIDNLTKETQDKFSALINSSRWHILVTSRQKLSPFKKIPLDCLSEDYCIDLYMQSYSSKDDLYMQNYGSKDDREVVKQLVQKAGHHTLAIELLGKTAAISEISTADLLIALKDIGFDLSEIFKDTVEARYGQQNEEIEELLYNHFKKLFDLSTLEEQQKIVLKQIAMLGISEQKAQYLKQWLGLKNKKILIDLAKFGWLQGSNKENNIQFYTLHPIIAYIALKEIA